MLLIEDYKILSDYVLFDYDALLAINDVLWKKHGILLIENYKILGERAALIHPTKPFEESTIGVFYNSILHVLVFVVFVAIVYIDPYKGFFF